MHAIPSIGLLSGPIDCVTFVQLMLQANEPT